MRDLLRGLEPPQDLSDTKLSYTKPISAVVKTEQFNSSVTKREEYKNNNSGHCINICIKQ